MNLCKHCSQPFKPRGKKQYCSTTCRVKAHYNRKSGTKSLTTNTYTPPPAPIRKEISPGKTKPGKTEIYSVGKIKGPSNILGKLLTAGIGGFIGHQFNKEGIGLIVGGSIGWYFGSKFTQPKYIEVPNHSSKPINITDDVSPVTNNNMVTAADLRKMKFDTFRINGKYSQLMGDVEKGFAAAVYGLPGSGKSTFCLELSNHLANIGTVAYFSAEEGIRKSVQQKLELMQISNPHIHLHDCKTINQVKKTLESGIYQYAIIDSLNELAFNPVELKEIRNKHQQISFIGIMQSTKDGKFKGDNSFAHDVDIVLKVDNGIVSNDKNRYGGTGEVNVFNIQKGMIRQL